MSEPKEKYFIINVSEGEIFNRKTLPEALNLISEWLTNGDEDDARELGEQIRDKDLILIKGTEIEIRIETTRKAIQK